MDRNARSGRNESAFSKNIDSLNSCEVDSLISELKNSVSQKSSGILSGNKSKDLSLPKEILAVEPEETVNFNFGEEETLGTRKKKTILPSARIGGIGRLENGAPLSRLSSACPPGLPVPGKRLQSLMNRVNAVQKRRNISPDQPVASRRTDEIGEPLEREYVEEQKKSGSGFQDGTPDSLDGGILRCEELLDQLKQCRLQSQSNISEETSSEVPEAVHSESAVENEESVERLDRFEVKIADEFADINEEECLETEEKDGSAKIQVPQKTSRIRRGILFSAEVGCGLLFGVGFVFFLMNTRNPIEKRVLHEFQRAVPFATVTCDMSEIVYDRDEMTFGPIAAEAVSDRDRSQDFQIRKTSLSFYPVSRISRSLRTRSASLEGVEFPNLGALTLCDAWRPTPIAPLFSDEIKTVLADKNNSLESLCYLEKVKEKHLPVYREISAEVARINSEMETYQTRLTMKLNLEKWNPEILKSEEAKRPDVVEDLTRIGELRREAIAVQNRWMELNQAVAADLALVREKIVQDGRAFSNILHFAWPTDDVLNEYLFKTDIQKRLAESIHWSSALSQMAEMGMLAHSRRPAETLKTTGNIELFGQNFCFASDWNSQIADDDSFSYYGTLRLDSDTIPAEYLKDAFVSISGRSKDGLPLRTVSARVSLPNEAFVWGDYASLPLHGHAQNATVVLSLTIFGDKLSGNLTLEMERVAFDMPEANAEKAAILFKQFEKKVIPGVQVVANISGTTNDPVLEYSSSVAQELRPDWELALQEIHQKTRKEIITSIYEKLKNAETGFNVTLEPFYQEMLVCAQKTDLFRDFPLLKGKIPSSVQRREATVEVVPMNIAHLEVHRIDLDENIPTYDPNLGISPVTVAAPVGNQVAEPAKTIKKSVPVKKVVSIESLSLSPTKEEGNVPAATVPENVPAVPVTVPENVSAVPATVPETSALSSSPNLSETEQIPPAPNVADPVFYSTKQKKELKPMDIPINKKNSMPLPMMKSVSNFGS